MRKMKIIRLWAFDKYEPTNDDTEYDFINIISQGGRLVAAYIRPDRTVGYVDTGCIIILNANS